MGYMREVLVHKTLCECIHCGSTSLEALAVEAACPGERLVITCRACGEKNSGSKDCRFCENCVSKLE